MPQNTFAGPVARRRGAGSRGPAEAQLRVVTSTTDLRGYRPPGGRHADRGAIHRAGLPGSPFHRGQAQLRAGPGQGGRLGVRRAGSRNRLDAAADRRRPQPQDPARRFGLRRRLEGHPGDRRPHRQRGPEPGRRARAGQSRTTGSIPPTAGGSPGCSGTSSPSSTRPAPRRTPPTPRLRKPARRRRAGLGRRSGEDQGQAGGGLAHQLALLRACTPA